MTTLTLWALGKLEEIRNSDEEGQGLVEYVLIISLVGLALVVGLGALATGIGGKFTDVVTDLG